ncbi:hypothetical protein F4678DRAFT_445572 [Xylaria arbuscula]|nr:hypothetical protein F4678DRAFT_445572 [Xylaria arbuscula]
MIANNLTDLAKGHVQTAHSFEGLPRVARHMAAKDAQGKSVFLATDDATAAGDHARDLNRYLNSDSDVQCLQQNEASITLNNGTACRMIDFAPGGVLPMRREGSLDYAVVIEGAFRMVLDSGEERMMQRGDVAVQRCTSHSWVNVTGDGLLPGRVLFVSHDFKDLKKGVRGSKMDGLGAVLGDDSVGYYSNHGTYNYYESDLQ